VAEPFDTLRLTDAPRVTAPDGSVVRPLGLLPGSASVARFELAAGAVSRAVTHATVAEVWHVVSGAGRLWRRQDGREEVTELVPGLTVTIPLGTHFQFRADRVALVVLGVTAPPWPDTPDEAREVAGHWPATVDRLGR
jgi:mannose-6-phosphate isomerase-like protein (cupin superfamily)